MLGRSLIVAGKGKEAVFTGNRGSLRGNDTKIFTSSHASMLGGIILSLRAFEEVGLRQRLHMDTVSVTAQRQVKQ
ncbi:hypothetical protein KC363_g236 [Hortaea werneckii]|nr:hypothetical protein KC363_g236 [Hortaea werneckii]